MFSNGGNETWAWSEPESELPGGTVPDEVIPDSGSGNGEGHVYYVYVTITDFPNGLRDQTVFRVQYGGDDEGADNGDPHLTTLNGVRYDFQGVGEFTLVRDSEGMEGTNPPDPRPDQDSVHRWL